MHKKCHNKLKELTKGLEGCAACDERHHANLPVMGRGSLNAEVVFIGRNPGPVENIKGIPFAGKAGEQLDLALDELNLTRTEIWITNLVRCYTPSGQRPSIDAIERCSGWLWKELQLLQNLKYIVALGHEVVRFFKRDAFVSRIHGQPFEYDIPWTNKDTHHVTIFPTYHPGATIRSQKLRETFLADLQKLKTLLQESNNG